MAKKNTNQNVDETLDETIQDAKALLAATQPPAAVAQLVHVGGYNLAANLTGNTFTIPSAQLPSDFEVVVGGVGHLVSDKRERFQVVKFDKTAEAVQIEFERV